jgi:hypothetical protein
MKKSARAPRSGGGSSHTPEAMARAAVARKATTPSGHRVKLVLTLFLPHDVAEYVTARAIREGKNVAGVVAEILAADRRRR